MKVGLALEIDEEIDRLSNAVARIEDRLAAYFADKSYGDDVQALFIGVILTRPESERFHRVRPLKYRRNYTLRAPSLGLNKYLGNVVEFDIRPDYSAVRILNSEKAELHIIGALTDGIEVLTTQQKKFPNFDSSGFVAAFTACLSSLTDSIVFALLVPSVESLANRANRVRLRFGAPQH